MKLSGFTIARNVLKYGYPLEESLRSLLPLVDELVVAVGDSDDGTWDLVQSLRDPKIRAFPTVWNKDVRTGGNVLSEQTNLALRACTGDWGVYLQADEILHEDDHASLRAEMLRHLNDGTEGLTLNYLHFYGSFGTVQDHPLKWYPKAVRAVRLGGTVESWGDALGFRLALPGGRVRDLRTRPSSATVYHYGWVRPPQVMLEKQRNLDSLYHDDAWLADEYRAQERRVRDFYADRGNLKRFQGTHPAPMAARVRSQDWSFDNGIADQPPDWWRRLRIRLLYRLEVRFAKLRARLDRRRR